MGESDRTPSRIVELDGVRGLAILLVLLWHYLQNLLPPDSKGLIQTGLRHGLSLTWSGVDLFFVLSGFLIGRILLAQRSSPSYYKTFFIRRICRIFPPYYAVVMLYGLALLLNLQQLQTLGPLFENPIPFWAYLGYVQNFYFAHLEHFGPKWLGVTWSLAIEEQFYLLLPFLVRCLPVRFIAPLCFTCIVGATLLRAQFYGLQTYVSMPFRCDSLFVGVFIAYLVQRRNGIEYLRQHLWSIRVGLFAFGVIVGYLTLAQHPMVGVYHHTWLALFYGCLIALVLANRAGIAARLCRLSWLRRLGDLSYGIYLLHRLLLYLVHGVVLSGTPNLNSIPAVGATVLALLGTLLLAGLSHRYFERPIVRFGHRYTYA